ncbi:MAG: hypothetical protein WC734_05555 [Patescibacteria group bacterium]
MIFSAVILSIIYIGYYLFATGIPEAAISSSEILGFVYAIAISIIAAGIFYLFQVYIPEKKRKDIIRGNFKLNYTHFKEDSISIFLSALGHSHDVQLLKKLSGLEEFKNYFKENHKEGRDRWNGVLNGLNESLLKDLLVQFEILTQEIDFYLSNISLHDEEVFSFLKRLKITTQTLKNTSLNYDEVKRLSGFLWELFSGWSFISGYRKNDIFEEMLDRV